jgi:hypothetical protein
MAMYCIIYALTTNADAHYYDVAPFLQGVLATS